MVLAKPARSVLLAAILPPTELNFGVPLHQFAKEFAKVLGPWAFILLAPGHSSLLPVFLATFGLGVTNAVDSCVSVCVCLSHVCVCVWCACVYMCMRVRVLFSCCHAAFRPLHRLPTPRTGKSRS
jgi:hypothetical protein